MTSGKLKIMVFCALTALAVVGLYAGMHALEGSPSNATASSTRLRISPQSSQTSGKSFSAVASSTSALPFQVLSPDTVPSTLPAPVVQATLSHAEQSSD